MAYLSNYGRRLRALQPTAIRFQPGVAIAPVRGPAWGLKKPVDRPLQRPVLRRVTGLGADADPSLPPPNPLKTILVLLAIPVAFMITGKE